MFYNTFSKWENIIVQGGFLFCPDTFHRGFIVFRKRIEKSIFPFESTKKFTGTRVSSLPDDDHSRTIRWITRKWFRVGLLVISRPIYEIDIISSFLNLSGITKSRHGW